MPQVTVTINGKTYRMACDEGQEGHLQFLAETFDGYVGQLKGAFGEIGDQRLTVMAGVMVTDELVEMRRKIKSMEADIATLRASRDQVIDHASSSESELARQVLLAAEKIETISAKLNGPRSV
ncbi:MAG: cell division protein ZapA [Nitratireductor sp.]